MLHEDLPSWEQSHIPGPQCVFESMMFLFKRWDISDRSLEGFCQYLLQSQVQHVDRGSRINLDLVVFFPQALRIPNGGV